MWGGFFNFHLRNRPGSTSFAFDFHSTIKPHQMLRTTRSTSPVVYTIPKWDRFGHIQDKAGNLNCRHCLICGGWGWDNTEPIQNTNTWSTEPLWENIEAVRTWQQQWTSSNLRRSCNWFLPGGNRPRSKFRRSRRPSLCHRPTQSPHSRRCLAFDKLKLRSCCGDGEEAKTKFKNGCRGRNGCNQQGGEN